MHILFLPKPLSIDVQCLIHYNGIPYSIASDQGSHFTSEKWDSGLMITDSNGINYHAPCYPKGAELIEK